MNHYYDVFAPSSTSSTGRVIDHLSLNRSYHTFMAGAYLHVDEDAECYVDPLAELLEQQSALGNSTSVLLRLRKELCGRRRPGTRWVNFMIERLEEQSFERCDAAAPQMFADYELDVFMEVHMDDPHGTRPGLALEQIHSNS